MFEKEIDFIYELCKRVVEEVPTAFIKFEYTPRGLHVCGKKEGAAVYAESSDTFHWDIMTAIYHDPDLSVPSRAAYEQMKAFLFELLTDGKCPNE